ncbi:MAG: helix-hairpin-helix domain-containing protein [Bacteroidota bacterium]|nr:helix-hairpin-helix domain-containing protein [Bacteroidota bacterium]
MWKHFLKDYFNFTRKERSGVIVLVSFILILILAPFFYPFFIEEKIPDHTQFEKEIAQLRTDSTGKKNYSKNSDNNYYNDYSPSGKKYYPPKAEVFFFDPNTASENDWIRLGIKEKTAATIQKYISKGGKFYKPEDIKKIWGLHPADVERLLPYVSIKNAAKEYPQFEKKEYEKNTKSFITKTLHPVDINLADTSDYIALPGIGSKLSQRIISFREKLGGFYSIDQVAETYFLPDSTFQKIKPYLVLKNNSVKQININSASVDEMKTHPYLRYNLANAIAQYRKQHGNFKSVEEVKKIMLITEEIYNKASPYLALE